MATNIKQAVGALRSRYDFFMIPLGSRSLSRWRDIVNAELKRQGVMAATVTYGGPYLYVIKVQDKTDIVMISAISRNTGQHGSVAVSKIKTYAKDAIERLELMAQAGIVDMYVSDGVNRVFINLLTHTEKKSCTDKMRQIINSKLSSPLTWTAIDVRTGSVTNMRATLNRVAASMYHSVVTLVSDSKIVAISTNKASDEEKVVAKYLVNSQKRGRHVYKEEDIASRVGKQNARAVMDKFVEAGICVQKDDGIAFGTFGGEIPEAVEQSFIPKTALRAPSLASLGSYVQQMQC